MKKGRKEDMALELMRPSLTAEAEENEVISLAIQTAKRQILEGTASSQVITHYLKLGSEKEKKALELENMRLENELTKAKKEQIDAIKRADLMYEKVLTAMKKYSGISTEIDEDDIHDFYE